MSDTIWNWSLFSAMVVASILGLFFPMIGTTDHRWIWKDYGIWFGIIWGLTGLTYSGDFIYNKLKRKKSG